MTIKELVGNVATKEDRISIAHVNVTNPASEPWLTLHYDEYICVLKGKILLQHANGELEVNAGDSVFIEKGERFRPIFPGKFLAMITKLSVKLKQHNDLLYKLNEFHILCRRWNRVRSCVPSSFPTRSLHSRR